MGVGGITPAMKLKTAACILRLSPNNNGGITNLIMYPKRKTMHLTVTLK